MNISILNIFILVYLVISNIYFHVSGCGSKRISCLTKTSYKFCFMAGQMVMEIGNVKYCPKDSVCSENEGTVPCLQLTKIEELEIEYIPVASTDSSYQELYYFTTPAVYAWESTTYTPFVTTVSDISKQESISLTTLEDNIKETTITTVDTASSITQTNIEESLTTKTPGFKNALTSVTEFSNTSEEYVPLITNYLNFTENEYETGLLKQAEPSSSTIPTLEILEVDASIVTETENPYEEDPVSVTSVEEMIEAPSISTVDPPSVTTDLTTQVKDTLTEKEISIFMKETTPNTGTSPSNKYISMDLLEDNTVFPASTENNDNILLITSKLPSTEFQEIETSTENVLKTETSATSQWVPTTLSTLVAEQLSTEVPTNIFKSANKHQGNHGPEKSPITTTSSTTPKESIKFNFLNNQNTINNYFFMVSYLLNTTTQKEEQLRNEATSTEVNVVSTKPSSDKMVTLLTPAATLSVNKETNNFHIWRRDDTNSEIELLTPGTTSCTENTRTTSTTTANPQNIFNIDFSTTRSTFNIFPYTRVSRPICFGTGKYPSEVCNKYYECVRIMWWFQLRIRTCRLGQSFNPVTLNCQRDSTCWGTFY